MRISLRKRAIGWGFELWAWAVRLRRRLTLAGRPRLGALDHITIPVRDLAIARKFYCDVLGAAHFMTVDDETFRRFGRPPAPNQGEGAHHLSVYPGGATRVDLFSQSTGQPETKAGHPHFAFRVSPKGMRDWRGILARMNIPFDGPIRLGPPGQASLYFNDPFGNHLEVTCFGYDDAIPIRPPVMANLSWTTAVVI